MTPATTLPALLIVDMQVGMTWLAPAVRNNPRAEQVMAALLKAWRNDGRSIVHIRHISRTPGSPFWPGQPDAEFQPALAPLAGEHVVEKNVPDTFINTGIERRLHMRGISSVVIAGVSTNNSVESTARTAGNLGLRTFVVTDTTFAFEKTDFNGAHRTAEDVHAMALANLHGEYATVIAADLAATVD